MRKDNISAKVWPWTNTHMHILTWWVKRPQSRTFSHYLHMVWQNTISGPLQPLSKSPFIGETSVNKSYYSAAHYANHITLLTADKEGQVGTRLHTPPPICKLWISIAKYVKYLIYKFYFFFKHTYLKFLLVDQLAVLYGEPAPWGGKKVLSLTFAVEKRSIKCLHAETGPALANTMVINVYMRILE